MSIGLGLGTGLGVPITYTATSTATTTTWLPGDFISSWQEDGTTISFPIASLSNHNLTAANADATTGDARQTILSLCGRMFEYYNELTTQPDFKDIAGVVQSFVAAPGAPIKARAQLQPNVPDPDVNVDFKDIAEAVAAFVTHTYPYDGPDSCS